jgi:type VI secretion system protein ImpH
MAGPDRYASADLAAVRALQAEPHRFSLFAAMRLLEDASPDRPRIGAARRPTDEGVRFSQPPHVWFAPSDVIACDAGPGGRLRIEQYGFGVFGPNGALPLHLTEYAYERSRHHDDDAVADFINLFQHRFTELFYRAWAEADPVASASRPQGDWFVLYLGALFGLWGSGALQRDSVDDGAKLSRAGLLAPGSRSADGLEALLADFFGLAVEVRQFVGEWLAIPDELRTRLDARGQAAVLGTSATLGKASWQCQYRYEIVVGPLRYETFLQMLPGSRALRELRDLVRLYTSGEQSCAIRLTLAAGEAPGMELGRSGRLGWTSWIGKRNGVADDVILQAEHMNG